MTRDKQAAVICKRLLMREQLMPMNGYQASRIVYGNRKELQSRLKHPRQHASPLIIMNNDR